MVRKMKKYVVIETRMLKNYAKINPHNYNKTSDYAVGMGDGFRYLIKHYGRSDREGNHWRTCPKCRHYVKGICRFCGSVPKKS